MEAGHLALTRPADERATRVARTAPDAGALGRLVMDVLLRQAQGKVLASPAGYVAARARERGLDRPQAETPFGNLLTILERGAESAGEIDVIGAFFVQGLRDELE